MKKILALLLLTLALAMVMTACAQPEPPAETTLPTGDILTTQDGRFRYRVVLDEIILVEVLAQERSIIIPPTIDSRKVTVIGDSAFFGNEVCEKISLPETIHTIGNNAFAQCTALTELELPAGVKTLEGTPFYGCSALTRILVSPDSPSFTDVQGVLFSKDMTVLLAYPEGKTEPGYTVPESVTLIQHGAFGRLPQLSKLYLPAHLSQVRPETLAGKYDTLSLIVRTAPRYSHSMYLLEASRANVICAEVPVFLGDDTEVINEAVEAFIQDRLSALCGGACAPELMSRKLTDFSGEYTSYAIELTAEIMSCGNDLISITFTGLCNYRPSAHPTNLHFTLNLDPKTGEPVSFTDLFTLDEALYDRFAAYGEALLLEQMQLPSLAEYGGFASLVCPPEAFLSGLLSGKEYGWYIREDHLGIIVPVSHVLGDFFEVQLPLDEV